MKVKAVTARSLHDSGHMPFEGFTGDRCRISAVFLLEVVAAHRGERHVACLRERLEVL